MHKGLNKNSVKKKDSQVKIYAAFKVRKTLVEKISVAKNSVKYSGISFSKAELYTRVKIKKSENKNESCMKIWTALNVRMKTLERMLWVSNSSLHLFCGKYLKKNFPEQ